MLSVVLIAMLFAFLSVNSYRSASSLIVFQYAVVTVISCLYVIASSTTQIKTWRNIGELTPEIVFTTQLLYILFLAGVFIASILVVERKASPESHQYLSVSNQFSVRQAEFFTFVFLFAGITLYGIYILLVGISSLVNTNNFAQKYADSTSTGPLYFGLTLIIMAAFWAETEGVSRWLNKLARGTIIVVLIWVLFFVHTRWPIVMTGVGYFSIIARRSDMRVRNIKFHWVLAGAVGLVLFEGFSIYRGLLSSGAGWQSLFSGGFLTKLQIAFGGSELVHPFITAGEVIKFHIGQPANFLSFFSAFKTLIPSFLISDRGLSEAQQFAQIHYSTLFQRGGGTGYTIVGGTFKYFPVYIGTFLTGLSIGLYNAYIDRYVAQKPRSVIAGILPALFFYALFSERMGMIAYIKQLILIGVVTVLVYIGFMLIYFAVQKPRFQTRRITE